MSAPDAPTPAELADATRRFLEDHVARLARSPALPPEAVVDLVAALTEGVDGTLRDALRDAHAALGAPDAAPRDDPAAVLAESARVADGDAALRLAWAHAALEKRVDELTGTLFAFRQTLLANPPPSEDVDAVAARATRLHRAASRTADGAARLVRALAAWRDAAEGTLPPAWEARAADALVVARRALDVGAPEAAWPALRVALRAALAAKATRGDDAAAVPGPLESALAAWTTKGAAPPVDPGTLHRLDAFLGSAPPARDPVLAWRVLDTVEWVVERVATSRPPDR